MIKDINIIKLFHQTGQGKTADSELTMDNSIYGLPQGSAFSLKGDNTYQSTSDFKPETRL